MRTAGADPFVGRVPRNSSTAVAPTPLLGYHRPCGPIIRLCWDTVGGRAEGDA